MLEEGARPDRLPIIQKPWSCPDFIVAAREPRSSDRSRRPERVCDGRTTCRERNIR